VSFSSDLSVVVVQRDFRRLFAPRLASGAADGLFQVALASYVFFTPEKQATSGAAALTFATLLLPYSFAGPFAGVFLDRWRRRHVLVRTNMVRTVLVAITTVLMIFGVRGVPIFLAALLILSGGRFYSSAMSASLPHVVARRDLVMANSVWATSGSLVAMAGGAVGLLLHMTWRSSTSMMVITGLGYAGAAALASRLHPDRLGPDGEIATVGCRQALRHTAGEMIGGVRHVLDRPAARNALALITIQRFCYGTGTIATLLLYRNYFHDPSSNGDAAMAGLGWVFAAGGLGYFVAAVITPELTPRIGKTNWIIVSMAWSAVFGFALVVPYEAPPIVLGSFVIGMSAQAVKICVDTIVQENVEDEFRGRVFAFYDMLFNCAFVASAAVASLTMPESGKSYVILISVSVLYALAGILYGKAAGQHRRPLPTISIEPPPQLAPIPVRVEAEELRPLS
jgi:MFS family permease